MARRGDSLHTVMYERRHRPREKAGVLAVVRSVGAQYPRVPIITIIKIQKNQNRPNTNVLKFTKIGQDISPLSYPLVEAKITL